MPDTTHDQGTQTEMIEGEGSLDGTLAPSVFRVPERCPPADTAKAQRRHSESTAKALAKVHSRGTDGRAMTASVAWLKGHQMSSRLRRTCAGRRQEGWLAGSALGSVGWRAAVWSLSLAARYTLPALPAVSIIMPCHAMPCHARCAMPPMRRGIPDRPCPRVGLSASRPPGHTRSGLREL